MDKIDAIFDDFYIEWQNQDNYKMECKKQIDNLIDSCNFQKEWSILDLCCGCGFHSRYLNEQGYKVHSMDASLSMLNYAKKVNGIVGVQQTIQEGIPFNDLDMILCLNTSIGYNNYDLSEVVEKAYKSLKKDGRLVIDLINITEFKKNFKSTMIFYLSQYTIKQKGVINDLDNSVNTLWRVYDVNGIEIKNLRKQFRLKLYTRNEVEEVCRKLKVKNIQFYGGYNKEILTKNTKRMVVIIEK